MSIFEENFNKKRAALQERIKSLPPSCTPTSLSIIASDLDKLISSIRQRADFRFLYSDFFFEIHINNNLILTIKNDHDNSYIDEHIIKCTIGNIVQILVQLRKPEVIGISNFDHKITIELFNFFHRWTVEHYLGPITYDFDYEQNIGDNRFIEFRDASNENIAEGCSSLFKVFFDNLEKKGI